MNILVACEQSGRVRAAFRRRGHNAYSADVAPARDGGPHLLGDVRRHLDLPWDMIIAFPPCTYLTRASSFRWKTTELEIAAAAQFIRLLYDSAALACIENPPGWLNTHWRKPTQIVHPYWFGLPFSKQTGLWLKGLPALQATRRVEPGASWVRANCPDSGQRMYRRSITPEGMAEAMAEQWS